MSQVPTTPSAPSCAEDQPTDASQPGTLPSLVDLGWNEQYRTDRGGAKYAPEDLGRVARLDRTALTVLTAAGPLRCTLAPRIRNDRDPFTAPTVGDWVLLDGLEIVEVFPRRSLIVRGSARADAVPQVLAANVDKVFVTCSLSDVFRPRRIERLLVLAWQSGAAPVLVLTKSDLAGDVPSAVAQAQRLMGSGDVVAVSSVSGDGLDGLERHLIPAHTVVLLGSSGAGKSTLINRLSNGAIELATGEVRSDGRGRHTTTARELIRLPGGALLVDMPGVRSLALFDASQSIGDAFSDMKDLAALCRFSDCSHSSEPNCAVREAVEAGELEPGRLESYENLLREQRHLDQRVDPKAQAEIRARNRARGKVAREAQRARPDTPRNRP